MNGFTNDINMNTGQVNVGGAGEFMTNPANMPNGYKESGNVNVGYLGSGDNNLKFMARKEMVKPTVPAVIKELITTLPADHPLRESLIKYENIILTIQRESVWNINADDAAPMALSAGTLYECWRSYKELQDVLTTNNKIFQNITFSKVISDLFRNQGALDLLVANGYLTQDAINVIVASATDQRSPIDFTALVQGAMLELGAWLLRGMAVEYNVTTSPEAIASSISDALNKAPGKPEAERDIMNILASFGIIRQDQVELYMNNQVTYSLADRIVSLSTKPKSLWSQDDWNYEQMVNTYLTYGQLPVEQNQWAGNQQPVQPVQQQPVMTTINGGQIVQQVPVQQPVQQMPIQQVPVLTNGQGAPITPVTNATTLSSGTVINKGGPTQSTVVSQNLNNNQGGNQMQLTNYVTSQPINQGGYIQQPVQQPVATYTNNGPQFNNPAYAPQPIAQVPAPAPQVPMAGWGQPVQQQPVTYAPVVQQPVQQTPMVQGWGTPTTSNYTYTNQAPVQPNVPIANAWGNNQPATPVAQFPQGLGSPNENDKSVTDRAILYYTVKDYGAHDPVTNSKYLSLIDPTTGLVEICTEFYYNTRRETLRNPAYGNNLLRLQQQKSAPVYGTPQIINLPDNYQPQQLPVQQVQQQVPMAGWGQPVQQAPMAQVPAYNPYNQPQAPNVMNGWNTNAGFNQPVSTGMILPGYN